MDYFTDLFRFLKFLAPFCLSFPHRSASYTRFHSNILATFFAGSFLLEAIIGSEISGFALHLVIMLCAQPLVVYPSFPG